MEVQAFFLGLDFACRMGKGGRHRIVCLIAFRFGDHPHFRLILAANRDEFYNRPTLPAAFHSDETIFSGRDLLGGGTWLGVNRRGQVAAVTNIRHPDFFGPARRSRGELVMDFLRSDLTPLAYLEGLRERAELYGGFNLLLFSGQEALVYHSATGTLERVESGVHAVSNHALNTDWPKVRRIRQALLETSEALPPEDSERACESLLDLLLDNEQAPDAQLPDTGIGLERERILSSAFIHTEGYGTRSSSVVLITHGGQLKFVEHSHVPKSEVSIQFQIR